MNRREILKSAAVLPFIGLLGVTVSSRAVAPGVYYKVIGQGQSYNILIEGSPYSIKCLNNKYWDWYCKQRFTPNDLTAQDFYDFFCVEVGLPKRKIRRIGVTGAASRGKCMSIFVEL
jgi:hypothetical protein